MIRVLIVDDLIDHQTYLFTACNHDTGIQCIGLADNGNDAIRKARQLKPDVIMLDIGLPDISGIECMLRIMEDESHHPKFMICTVHEEDEFIFDALKAGAHSYITKGSRPHQITEAIKDVYKGERPISSSIATKILAQVPMLRGKRKAPDPAASLTEKEKEILNLLAKGLSYQEVADHVSISIKTLKWHVYNIYGKLQADNRTEAINKYFGYEV